MNEQLTHLGLRLKELRRKRLLTLQQLAEQTEINQRLEHEFKMGAREAVVTRRIAYWSLAIGIAGVLLAIIALIKNIWG